MPVAVATLTLPFPEAAQAELQRIYADSPEFPSPEAAMAALEQAMAAGEQLYVGVFNDRHIAAVLVGGAGDVRQMRFLCVHAATRGRGVAERLVAEVRRLEGERGATWLEAAFDLGQPGIADMLLALGFIPHGEGHYRCRLAV